MSADPARTGIDRFSSAALTPPVFDLVFVAAEVERIRWTDIGIGFGKGARVYQHIDVLLVADGVVERTFRADPVAALEGFFIVRMATPLALDPDALRYLTFYAGL